MSGMGKVKEYIPIALSIIISSAAIMALLAMIEPGVFSLAWGVVPDSTALVAEDSIATAKTEMDSLSQHIVAKNEQPVRLDSSTAALHRGSESVRTAIAASDTTELPGFPPVGPDTLNAAERRVFAQIFDAMDAESAARILNNMNDKAVKQVLTAMKKRQSAKILAALDPKQAARILKESL